MKFVDDFYLNTANMDAVIAKVQGIARIMEDAKEEYQDAITELTDGWIGKSRVMFDKRSAQLLRTLTDLSQSFFEIGEELLTASESYMQADTDAAKAIDGVSSRY